MEIPHERNPPVPMGFEQKDYIRKAATRVFRLYPRPVSVVLSKELHDWADFGYRFGGASTILKLARFIHSAPVTDPAPPPPIP